MLCIQSNQRLNCISLFILLLSAVLLGLVQASSPETRISNSIHHHHVSTKRSSNKRNRAVPGVTRNKRLLQGKKSKKEDLPLPPTEDLPDETVLPPTTGEEEDIEGIPPPDFNNEEEDEKNETPPVDVEENEGVDIPPDVEEGPLEHEEKHDLHPPLDAPSNHNGTKTIASYSVAEYSARNNSSSSSVLYYLFGIAIVVAGTIGIIQVRTRVDSSKNHQYCTWDLYPSNKNTKFSNTAVLHNEYRLIGRIIQLPQEIVALPLVPR